MKCKGIIAIAPGDPRMIEVDVPEPGPHEVQIRMAASLVSAGTERAWVQGLPNATPAYPYVPGYCCAGQVVKTGKDVTGFQPGDRVASFAVDVGHREIGNVFMEVLEDAGVYKRDPEGQAAFDRFLSILC